MQLLTQQKVLRTKIKQFKILKEDGVIVKIKLIHGITTKQNMNIINQEYLTTFQAMKH